MAVREEQKGIIPLFMETQFIIDRHREAMDVLDDPALNDQVPR